MPEYTKDQIDEAKLWLTTNDTGNSYSQKRRIGFEAIILSALDTAESEIIDLERRISSLTELERESEAEGNESMATVWRKRRERVQALLDAKNKKRGKKYAKTI